MHPLCISTLLWLENPMGKAFEAVNPSVPCSKVLLFSCAVEGYGRIITNSSHMITQTMPDLKLKPRVSRRKLKSVLKLNESKMFFLCTGHANQVHYPLDYEQSLFFLGPSGPPSFLASRGFAAQRSRARAISLLNLKKKRDCS